MTITLDEEEYLRRVLELVTENETRLSAWELGFIEDQRTRFEKDGGEIFMSSKQWVIVQRISEKVGM
jgi:hypothetical protein